MRRLVIDTNLYVDWINAGRHGDVIFEAGAVKYLSAVVLMELRAHGALLCRTRPAPGPTAAGGVREGRTNSRADRGGVRRSGGDPATAAVGEGLQPGKSHSIVNDVLIALSARASGAVVVTQNERDFRAIQAIRPFRLEVVPAA